MLLLDIRIENLNILLLFFDINQNSHDYVAPAELIHSLLWLDSKSLVLNVHHLVIYSFYHG